MVPWLGKPDQVTGAQRLMYKRRTTATERFAKNRNTPVRLVTAKRVLTDDPAGEMDVDMCSRLPVGKDCWGDWSELDAEDVHALQSHLAYDRLDRCGTHGIHRTGFPSRRRSHPISIVAGVSPVTAKRIWAGSGPSTTRVSPASTILASSTTPPSRGTMTTSSLTCRRRISGSCGGTRVVASSAVSMRSLNRRHTLSGTSSKSTVSRPTSAASHVVAGETNDKSQSQASRPGVSGPPTRNSRAGRPPTSRVPARTRSLIAARDSQPRSSDEASVGPLRRQHPERSVDRDRRRFRHPAPLAAFRVRICPLREPSPKTLA